MRYLFKGRLCGFICPECQEPLFNSSVRLYRIRKDQDVTALAVADPKETFYILDDKAIKAKESSLIAEVQTDEEGAFTFELDDKQYQGGPFEVDVFCGTVPHLPPVRHPPSPCQFSITTIQPRWIERDDALVAFWDYCIPAKYWCSVRARFGAWTICGRVTGCTTGQPLADVTVMAFDVDWLQDDPLGSATTDAAGKFRIDYPTSAFRRTPFSPLINVELVPGPDLYFRAQAADGTVLLSESASRGRQVDRQNVGHCFCVELCIDVDGGCAPYCNPLFSHVGDFDIIADIDSTTGLTNKAVFSHGGPDFGFFGGLKLKGFVPKTAPLGAPDPMAYRFTYIHPDDPTTDVRLTGPRLVPVNVGDRWIMWDRFGTGLALTPQSITVAGSGATVDPTPPPPVPPGTPWGPPPAHVIVPNADGWITVDQAAADGGFYGPLVRFDCAQAVPGGAVPDDGVGVPVSTGNQRNGVTIRVIFEVARISSGTFTPIPGFTQEVHVHVNNWNEVRLLGLLEFEVGALGSCTPLSSDLHIKYTTDHELMASWGIGITTAASIPPPAPTFPSGSGPRGGASTDPHIITTWPPCSYMVTLTTVRRLTDGETDDSGRTLPLTFCK
jgi:hypothetical protein